MFCFVDKITLFFKKTQKAEIINVSKVTPAGG